MYQPIRGQGGYLVFLISPKKASLEEGIEILLPDKFRWRNTNLVEGDEILLPIKSRRIPFSGFRGEVENVKANQRPGRPSCYSYRPEKTQT